MIHDQDGSIVECDWCGHIMDWRQEHDWGCNCKSCKERVAAYRYEHQIMDETWREFFRTSEGRYMSPRYGIPSELHGDLCRKCQIELTPWVHRFADIYMVHLANVKLERAINEQRKSRRT